MEETRAGEARKGKKGAVQPSNPLPSLIAITMISINYRNINPLRDPPIHVRDTRQGARVVNGCD